MLDGRLANVSGMPLRQEGRLLPVDTASGASHMARDAQLLMECAQWMRQIPRDPGLFPVLRFYHWSPPCLSLGRNQDLTNPRHGRIHVDALKQNGVDIVRRPSGGRAILHVNDLTYALVMPAVSEDISSSHRSIARGLAGGLSLLGIASDDQLNAEPSGRNAADCFASTIGADLQVNGRKLMGSAQRRSEGALLEHGTLYLSSPDPLYECVFGMAFGDSVLALDEALGHRVDFDTVARALTVGLQMEFGVRFQA